MLNPYLDKTVLWFEDADMAEEPTTFQTYSDKLTEVEEFIKKEGAPYFEKKAKDAATKFISGLVSYSFLPLALKTLRVHRRSFFAVLFLCFFVNLI